MDHTQLAEACERAALACDQLARSRERQAMTYAVGLSLQAALLKGLQDESMQDAAQFRALLRALRDGRVTIREEGT